MRRFIEFAKLGFTMLDTLGVTRQGYIGKEKDIESSLGDHGVRKYDYETGRFNSIDPLWEKYYGWTPYQYSMNNPIWAKDWDGRDIIVLLDKEGASGAGHMAVLIGNDDKGWQLYSKNGTNENRGAYGKSNFQAGEEKNSFDTFNDFLNNTDKNQIRYDVGYKITTLPDKDEIMKKTASEQVKRDYNLATDNCSDTAEDALQSVGKASGNTTNRDKEGNEVKGGKPLRPKDTYKEIKKGNAGKELDLNKMRKKGG